MQTPPSPYVDTVRPNVIWVIADQLRAQALSIAGDPNVHTPNIDRLARDGAWFPRAVSGFPLCCPARGSMLTGLYPHACVPAHEAPMDPSHVTIADRFNVHGYHTAWFGKWHLDGFKESTGRAAWHQIPRARRGRFATWLGYENNNSQFDCWLHGHQDGVELPLWQLPGHETGQLTDLLLAHIDRVKDRPFFACLSVQPPHDPCSPPTDLSNYRSPADVILRANVPPIPAVIERVRRDLSGYYGLIADLDRQVGRLLAHLDALGLANHTYVVFTADHGDLHGSHGHFQKMTPQEEAIRVPMMIWGGRRWLDRNGRMPDMLPNHVDLLPTTLGLAGLPVPADLPGFDYSPIMRLHGKEHRDWEATTPDSAYLQSVVPTEHSSSTDIPWRGVVTRDGWKYAAIPGQPWMMHDLNQDPYEFVNLALQAHARGRRQALNERVAQWIATTGDRFVLPEFTANGRSASTIAARKDFLGADAG